MHVGKVPVQLALKRQMHGRCDSIVSQPAWADVMVELEHVENAR